NAAFGLLLRQWTPYYLLADWVPVIGDLVGVLSYVGMAVAGFGIANEKRWGYRLGVVLTVGAVLLLFVAIGDIANLLSVGNLVNLLFTGALAALLLHPMSRDYQRVWFK